MEELYKRWPHRWITPKAVCKESKIHGIGVIAIEDIKKGEMIGIAGGIVVPISEVKECWEKIGGSFGTKVNDDFYIVPISREEMEKTGVFNHSCDPNTGWAGDIRTIAIKDIKKGEEITMDYGMYGSEIDPFKCNCGSLNCRKIIKPTDWKIKELQEKSLEYFSPYLKEKIKRMNKF